MISLALLLAGPQSQFPAAVERFLLAKDMGRHRRTPARLRL